MKQTKVKSIKYELHKTIKIIDIKSIQTHFQILAYPDEEKHYFQVLFSLTELKKYTLVERRDTKPNQFKI